MNDDNIVKILRRASDIRPPKPHPHDESEPCPGGCDDIKDVEATACKMSQHISELETRIKATDEQTIALKTLIGQISDQVFALMGSVAETKAALKQNTGETSEILGILRDGKTLFRISRHFGDFVKWGGGIAVVIGTLYFSFKDWIHK